MAEANAAGAATDPYNTGDTFTDSVLEESRRRRQTGIGGSTSPDIDYLNSPPYREGGIGTRESTNVDDRRGQDWDKTQPMATKVPKAGDFIENSRPSTPINTWTTAIRGARGFMETVNDTLGYLLNPQPTPEIDPGSEDAYARQLLAQRGQGRLAADVATTLAGTGSLAAVRRPGASLGSAGGRLKIHHGSGGSAIRVGDNVWSGINHADAAERAAKATGRTFDDIVENSTDGWVVNGRWQTSDEVGGLARQANISTADLPQLKIADDITLEWRKPHGGPDREFVIRRDGHRSVGEGSVWRDPDTGNLEIAAIDIRGIQKQGATRERIGPKIYDAIEANVGQLHPSISLTEDSMRLWQRRRPEAVKDKYVKETIDDEVTYTRK